MGVTIFTYIGAATVCYWFMCLLERLEGKK